MHLDVNFLHVFISTQFKIKMWKCVFFHQNLGKSSLCAMGKICLRNGALYLVQASVNVSKILANGYSLNTDLIHQVAHCHSHATIF